MGVYNTLMAYTQIESTQPTGYTTPPVVPGKVPKSAGFNFLPPGTVMVKDGGKWALYYYAAANVSYMVYDQGNIWGVTPILGKVRVSYAQGVAATKPCCQED